MSAEDLEKYETEMELKLYREYRDVVGLFKYVVETERRFYLTNDFDMQVRSVQGEVFFEVTMSDAWVWDMYRPARFVKQVRVVTFKDVNIEELDKSELELPKDGGFPSSLTLRSSSGRPALRPSASSTAPLSARIHRPASAARVVAPTEVVPDDGRSTRVGDYGEELAARLSRRPGMTVLERQLAVPRTARSTSWRATATPGRLRGQDPPVRAVPAPRRGGRRPARWRGCGGWPAAWLRSSRAVRRRGPDRPGRRLSPRRGAPVVEHVRGVA